MLLSDQKNGSLHGLRRNYTPLTQGSSRPCNHILAKNSETQCPCTNTAEKQNKP